MTKRKKVTPGSTRPGKAKKISTDKQSKPSHNNAAATSSSNSNAHNSNPTATRRPGTQLPTEETPSHLLALPPELRNNIYEHMFKHSVTSLYPTTTMSREPHRFTYKGLDTGGLQRLGLPEILAVSTQVRNEALGIYYSTTKFVAEEPHQVAPLLKRIGREYTVHQACVIYSHVDQEGVEMVVKRVRKTIEEDLVRGGMRPEEWKFVVDVEWKVLGFRGEEVVVYREKVVGM